MSRNTWKGQARKSRNTAGLASSNCKTQPLEEENRLCSTILQESEDRGNYTSSVTHLGDETLYGREYPQFKPRQLCNSTIRYLEPEPPLPGSEEVEKAKRLQAENDEILRHMVEAQNSKMVDPRASSSAADNLDVDEAFRTLVSHPGRALATTGSPHFVQQDKVPQGSRNNALQAWKEHFLSGNISGRLASPQMTDSFDIDSLLRQTQPGPRYRKKRVEWTDLNR
ncbi:MAG: hypothetical protein CYPHOPRED_003965 [Cyphobasidiales sp. Tagirdzhanova-0007]|nr:MAG: hypothetical protein CYPHOPRED_003965 [Cyphobasidiales sp. Tagirdzhanova-0007]